jgi:hypothetical protein
MQRISITNPQNVIDGTAKKYYFRLRNTGGPKGDKGDKGDTGATGPQGPQGNAATVSVGSTTTLPVGYDATVTNSGSLYNAVLDFGIPQGPQGPQGAKGDKGDTGAKGDTGPRGPQGEKGTNATVYVGTTSTLAPGSQATVYNSGSDSNAVLNFGIPQGAKGDTGSQGPQGPAGQNFAPTVVAELPAAGDESKLYLTPKAHTSQTATGNPITATITDGAGSVESFQLDGDTYQQTYTGKNLFNPSATPWVQNIAYNTAGQQNWGGYYGIDEYQPVEASTQYTFSNDLNKPIHYGLAYYDSSKTLISTTTADTTTFTTPANCAYIRFAIESSTAPTWVQLELGSTASSFEPFVGGIPSPNPDYPQPIQTVTGENVVKICGKNLFDKSTQVKGYLNTYGVVINTSSESDRTSVFIKAEPNTAYTLSSPGWWLKIAQYDSSQSFIRIDQSGANISAKTVTTQSNTAYIRISYGNAQNSPDVQLEKGSTATAYEPYSSNDYEIWLDSLSKNLFDKTTAIIGKRIGANGTTITDTAYFVSDFIRIKPNTQYVISPSTYLPYSAVATYKEDKTLITRRIGEDFNTITTESDAAFVRLATDKTVIDTTQFEEGATSSPYESYISAELCKLGDYQDYIWKDGDDWKVHKATSKYTFTGSEDGWLKSGASTSTMLVGAISIKPLDILIPSGASNQLLPVCNYFKNSSVQEVGIFWVFNSSGGYLQYARFGIAGTSSSTIDDFKNWLSSHNAEVRYPTTATDTAITNQTLIAQPEAIRTASLQNGTNTITDTATGSNLAGDMEIGYYGYNPRNRYDKWLWLDINNEYEQIGS